jgi:hypothetical protein
MSKSFLSLHLKAVGENANDSNYTCLGSLVITTQGAIWCRAAQGAKASTADVAVNIF